MFIGNSGQLITGIDKYLTAKGNKRKQSSYRCQRKTVFVNSTKINDNNIQYRSDRMILKKMYPYLVSGCLKKT